MSTALLRVATKKALLSAIQKSKKEIAVLIGSPLSMSNSSEIKGIPNVAGILDIIKNFIANEGLENDFNEVVLSKSQNDNLTYQASFNFLTDYISPETPNEIIRKAVLNAYSADTSNIDIYNEEQLSLLQDDLKNWEIPSATEYLARILTEFEKFTGPIFTPNFDPLLSIALNRLKKESNRILLHGDSSLSQYHSNNTNIVHFHGFWTHSDTLHTTTQLSISRPKLKASLSNILKNKTLLVIGYGGWNDIFTQSLKELINDDGATFDIIWSFYEEDSDIISKKYEDLITSMEPAIGRSRFRAYGGINCHDFLEELHTTLKINQQQNPPQKTESKLNIVEKDTASADKSDFGNSDIIVPEWYEYTEDAHLYIREIERLEILEVLDKTQIVNLVCDWGLGKDQFIRTLILQENSLFSKKSLYKINFSEIKNRKELIERVEEDYSFGLQDFISKMSKDDALLCLDNIDTNVEQKERKELESLIFWLSELLADHRPKCKIIVTSRNPFSHNIQSVEIGKLEEFDVRAYIKNHSLINDNIEDNILESLNELSKGIPSLLDKCIKELIHFSIDEVVESHFSPESYSEKDRGDFPVELKQRINRLKSSQDIHIERCYELLKIMTILENGDSFSNLKRAGKNYSFKPSHLNELYDLELIESVNSKKSLLKKGSNIGDEKLHKVSAIARDVVYRELTNKELYELTKRIADIHLGKNWRTGELNLCNLAKELILEDSASSVSTHIIIVQLLKCAIELNISRGIYSAIKIAISYCGYLSSKGKHRDTIKFTESFRAVSKGCDKISNDDICRLNSYEGSAFRMLGDSAQAEKLLEKAYDFLKEKSNPEKSRIKSVLIDLALLHQKNRNTERAKEIAEEILKIDNNNSHAKVIISETSESIGIQELKSLEKKLRDGNDIVVANNLALNICDKEITKDAKLKWVHAVLESNNDTYNKYRAINRKATILLEHDGNINLSKDELKTLHSGYIYSFSQKMTSIFNGAHNALWEYFAQNNNFSSLSNLFQHSSLFWRIYDNNSKERDYSNKLINLTNQLLPSEFDISNYRYVRIRIKQIKQ